MPKVIEVKVSPNGQTSIKVTGVKGTGCHKLTAPLEQDLGASLDTTNTADNYVEEVQTEIKAQT